MLENKNPSIPTPALKCEVSVFDMKKRHLKFELNFYKSAFRDNLHRRLKGYGWEYSPSKTVINIINKNSLSKNAGSKRVLDLGCGDGRHITYFRSLGFEVWGVDFSKEAIKLCKKRFKGDKKVHLKKIDLTIVNSLNSLGKFDIILDWSVLDHIRKEYLNPYIKNILNSMKKGGHIIISEFDVSIPDLYKNKNYKVVKEHYSKGYTAKALTKLLKPLIKIDSRLKILEDDINNYKLNTLLMKKV